MKTIVLLVMLCASAVSARAGYLQQGSPAVGGARRIVLIYNGRGHRNWQTDDFIPLIAQVNGKGRPLSAPLFDTFLVLPLALDTGHAFCPGFGEKPADRQALDAYINERLFDGRNQLRKLDDAVEKVSKQLKQPGLRAKVYLTLPFPIPTQRDFGPVRPGGPSLDLSIAEHRLAAVEWYRATVANLWRKAKYKRLDLTGWYWVEESGRPEDIALIKKVSERVHAAGKKSLFIPYNGAPGASKWASFGFDAAIFQPNYFFNRNNWPESMIDDAAKLARRNGMGLEMELDERVLDDARYRNRYRAYLAAARRQGAGAAVIAWYMGVASLVDCARSTDPNVRAIYDATVDFIRETSGIK